LHERHPQVTSHLARLKRVPWINVLLGPSIPRPDRGPEQKEKWARTMLILFKPWRTVRDLRSQRETWSSAFERSQFSEVVLKIMRNMRVEDECQDARDAHDALRK
ncbi:hypothetical protein K438DRAFT_1505185, partial [Mycena galopus ATCC 62051]